MNISEVDWEKYFPFDVPRPEQITSINAILNAFFVKNKRFFVLEAPIGIGKSAIAITLAEYFTNHFGNGKLSSVILTTQKILQEQYIKEFPDIANVSAKKNYVCKHRPGGLTCDIGLAMNRIVKQENYTCTYELHRKRFSTSNIALTNLHFYLNYQMEARENRRLMIVDECHNLESVMTDFVSLQFTKYFISEQLKIAWPIHNKITEKDFISWVKTKLYTQLESEISRLTKSLMNSSAEYLSGYKGMAEFKKVEEFVRMKETISLFLEYYDSKNWVISISATQDVVSVKPIHSGEYSNLFLFDWADKVLLMSSTILDKDAFCRHNGIPLEDTEFISMESPFPVKNRPIHVIGIGAMSKDKISTTLPRMMIAIEEVLNQHKKDKGIIHCHTYNIASYIKQNIKSDRLLIHGSDDRIEVLKNHLASDKPTVLLSPSFSEGVDLYGELSRFQIIVKVPFPYIGDKYIRTKMERVKDWYNIVTVKLLVQSYGRSIRDYDDYAETYIFDSDFKWFYERNKKLFPEWYKKAIKF
jgi:Rad3-related DNA helicase